MIRESDGACLGSFNAGNNIRGFDIHTIGGTAHLFSVSSWGVYTRNLSNNASRNCSHGNNYYLKNTFAIATNGNHLYAYFANRIARFNLVATGSNYCPQTSGYTTTTS